jgi:hypothetical protein
VIKLALPHAFVSSTSRLQLSISSRAWPAPGGSRRRAPLKPQRKLSQHRTPHATPTPHGLGHGSMPKRSASSRNSGRGRSPESWSRSRVTSRASRWVRVSSGAICSAPCRSRSALPSWRRMACAAARSVRTGTSPGTSTRRNTLRSGGKAQPETADARS